jgi:hypothetical protein
MPRPENNYFLSLTQCSRQLLTAGCGTLRAFAALQYFRQFSGAQRKLAKVVADRAPAPPRSLAAACEAVRAPPLTADAVMHYEEAIRVVALLYLETDERLCLRKPKHRHDAEAVVGSCSDLLAPMWIEQVRCIEVDETRDEAAEGRV